MHATSAQALVEHWSWASGKGLLKVPTARSLATACRGVLGVQDDWENLDIKTLDINDAFIRFENLRSHDFTQRSLRDYERRFRRAITSYLQYVEDPADWKYPSRASPSRVSRRSSQSNPPSDQDESADVLQPVANVADDSSPKENIQEYMYPFRPDLMARLTIPTDATTAEINRLVAWARTLAIDYEPSL